MAKVNIITRAFNRLEYTILCVREAHQKSNGANYTHIIIDQNSSDGTKEWLRSMEDESFYPIKVKYNNENSGDAGGMKDGFNLLDDDCEIIIQLDNDFIIETDNYIKLIEEVFNDTIIGGLMLYRNGVGRHLSMNKLIKTTNSGVKLFTTEPHILVFRRSILEEINLWYYKERISWVKVIPNKMINLGYKIFKTPSITLLHIDGSKDVTKPEWSQGQRYKKYFSNKNNNQSNYSTIKY
jgi:GT2 family glycosyltransferase